MAVVFLASRVLYGLAEEKQAPSIFLKTNRFGAPYVAVCVSNAFLFLVYLSLGSNSSAAFGWFVNIATIAALISWIIIEVTFLRFYYGLKVQGISRDRESFPSLTVLHDSLLIAPRSTIQEPLSALHGMDDHCLVGGHHPDFGLQRLSKRALEYTVFPRILHWYSDFSG